MSSTALFAAMCAIAAGLPAQQTWTVDKFNRAGTDFIDLQPAVDAAASGDVIVLRATSTSLADAYNAPVISGKALTILGEASPLVVWVLGRWDISGLPSGGDLVVSEVGIAIRQVPFDVGARFDATSNAGSIILRELTTGPGQGGSSFTDCNLVLIDNSTIDTGNWWWDFTRSTLMINDTTMFASTPSVGVGSTATLVVTDGTVHIAGSSIRGPDGASSTLPDPGVPLYLCRSSAYLSAGTVLEGGIGFFGTRDLAIGNWCSNGNPAPPWPDIYYDASTTFIGGMTVRSFRHPGPQSGVTYTMSPGSLQLDQHTTPSALTILLMAPLQTTPWTYVIGPVYLDPTNLWSDLAMAPASGPLSRTLPVPPTIPLGSMVGVQAFELTATGQLLASNVTVVGIFE